MKAGHPFISTLTPLLRCPPLPPGSLYIPTSGSNPDWDYRHKRGISKSRRLPLCGLQRSPCSFPGDLDWLSRFTQECGRESFCLSFSFMEQISPSKMKTWDLGGKAANNRTLTMTTRGEGWKVRATGSCVKGQGLQVAPSSQGWKVKCCLWLQMKRRRRTGRGQNWPPSRLPAGTQLRLSRHCLPSAVWRAVWLLKDAVRGFSHLLTQEEQR